MLRIAFLTGLMIISPAGPCFVFGDDWKPAEGRLSTQWAKEVTPDAVLPDYPRPQMVRRTWLNLNGLWDYAVRPLATSSKPEKYDGKILVPFPAESSLSGVMKQVGTDNFLWYRRDFEIPKDWSGQRVFLNFGGVDWSAIVLVNGKQVGKHSGGYDPFRFDITDVINAEGSQELVVAVWDPTDQGTQPRGKQVRKPGRIWYSPVTGIWQTVWLEPVPTSYIESIKIVPDLAGGHAKLTIKVAGPTAGNRVQVQVLSRSLGDEQFPLNLPKVSKPPGEPFEVYVGEPKSWTPDEPWLYQFSVTYDGSKSSDSITSYFGLRSVAVEKDVNGIPRLALNGVPTFHYGTLDQGWWPDGLYTAPTDAALRYDLEITKQLGFNMVRKHVKVEPARWYYHCDRMGLMVWQDMPNGDRHIRPAEADIERTEESVSQYEQEWRSIIDACHDHPCIVMWVPFNEGWGQFDTKRIVNWTKEYDPTRLVNNASGWSDRAVGDVLDIHAYPGPAMPPPESSRAVVLGEFGGLGLPVENHTWQEKNNWGYRGYKTTEALNTAYHELLVKLDPLIDSGLAAAVYTQTTDVETEVNGLMTYDRSVIKLDVPRAAEAHHKFYRSPRRLAVVMSTSNKGQPQAWRYTTESPADDWFKQDFDDSAWQSGGGGFGTASTPGAIVGTQWTEPDIWLRREFGVGDELPVNPYWRIHHDEDAEIYINGELVQQFSGYTSSFVLLPMAVAARQAIHAGKNVMAVHCKQTDGGQFIDVGIIDVRDDAAE